MNDDALKRIFQAKSRRRREMASLPFEEKIKILIQLQRLAKDIRKDIKFRVWKVGNSETRT